MTNGGDLKGTGADASFYLKRDDTRTVIVANYSDLDTIIRGTVGRNNLNLDSQYSGVSLPIYVTDNLARLFLTTISIKLNTT